MKSESLLALAAMWSVMPSLAYGSEATFDSNGVKIRYVTEGKGEAVVLVHGWMSDSTMWGRDGYGNTKLNTTGMEGFQLVALDCRGHGKSDKPHDPAQYGAEMAADVVRLLDHLKIKKAHLVGYSMGAFIVGNVAATHPERVLSVVYGGQAPLLAESPPSGSDEVEILAKAVDAGKGLGPYIIAVTPADQPKPTLEQANVIAKFMYAGKDMKAFAAAGRGFGGLRTTTEALKRCTAPTLFLHGSEESSYVKESITAARMALGRGDLKVVPGGTHLSTLAKPAFGASLIAFLHASKANG
ncbi:alpha/beta hydrolase [bacterium]|nr:MAG: alpha/beta hydrolase [bacterium]